MTHVRRHPIVTYRLSEWDGTPIKGTFYEPDVQKVQVSDDSLFRVENVLKRKGRNVLVRWKGWPPKYDSWIPAHGAKKTNNASKKKEEVDGFCTQYPLKAVTHHPTWTRSR